MLLVIASSFTSEAIPLFYIEGHTVDLEEKQFYVYILTNNYHTVFYVGMTSELQARIYQHKEKVVPGFTKRYNVDKLVYYEEIADSLSAIKREKQIKGGPRQKKIDLINSLNPEWRDLYNEL
jgi:putative endonuclease